VPPAVRAARRPDPTPLQTLRRPDPTPLLPPRQEAAQPRLRVRKPPNLGCAPGSRPARAAPPSQGHAALRASSQGREPPRAPAGPSALQPPHQEAAQGRPRRSCAPGRLRPSPRRDSAPSSSAPTGPRTCAVSSSRRCRARLVSFRASAAGSAPARFFPFSVGRRPASLLPSLPSTAGPQPPFSLPRALPAAASSSLAVRCCQPQLLAKPPDSILLAACALLDGPPLYSRSCASPTSVVPTHTDSMTSPPLYMSFTSPVAPVTVRAVLHNGQLIRGMFVSFDPVWNPILRDCVEIHPQASRHVPGPLVLPCAATASLVVEPVSSPSPPSASIEAPSLALSAHTVPSPSTPPPPTTDWVVDSRGLLPHYPHN
jgi:small nuclear ribonucleoprotein (snRNP)-like protein